MWLIREFASCISKRDFFASVYEIPFESASTLTQLAYVPPGLPHFLRRCLRVASLFWAQLHVAALVLIGCVEADTGRAFMPARIAVRGEGLGLRAGVS